MELQRMGDMVSQKSQETSQNTPTLPSKQSAAHLSMLIDKSRAAMAWNRLSEKEQDIAIITWYEILVDAGVPQERWSDCYRSAQQRKAEMVSQGKEGGIVTPTDLVVEWGKIKNLHYELDKSRLLTENAPSACQRCFGTNKEEMPNGSVKDSCSHLPLTDAEIKERSQAKAKSIEFMREAMKQINKPKPPVQTKPKFFHTKMECNYCHRRVDNPMGEAWKEGDTCNGALPNDLLCSGTLHEIKKIVSPFQN